MCVDFSLLRPLEWAGRALQSHVVLFGVWVFYKVTFKILSSPSVVSLAYNPCSFPRISPMFVPSHIALVCSFAYYPSLFLACYSGSGPTANATRTNQFESRLHNPARDVWHTPEVHDSGEPILIAPRTPTNTTTMDRERIVEIEPALGTLQILWVLYSIFYWS